MPGIKRPIYLLVVIWIVFISLLCDPHFCYSSTSQDVDDFLAANPAPSGCNNWTEPSISGTSKTVKVWRRCADNTIEYSKYYWSGLQPVSSAPSCRTYNCDGLNGLVNPARNWNNSCVYTTEAFLPNLQWSVNYYCDGRVVTLPTEPLDTCWGADTGLGCDYIEDSTCLKSATAPQDCTQFDTLLATFIIDLCTPDGQTRQTQACGGCQYGGTETCTNGEWGACLCNECTNGKTKPCYGPTNPIGFGTCKAGVQSCIAGHWDGNCQNQVLPAKEVCDGKDNNCNDKIDEGCDPCDDDTGAGSV